MPQALIHLAVSDDPLREALIEQLRLASFAINTGESWAVDAAAVVIDEAALDENRLSAWHNANQNVPVLLLGGGEERCAGLIVESFPKPLRLGQLLTRLRYHVETAPRLRSAAFIIGPYRFDLQERKLTVIDSGDIIRLTEKEAALLGFIGQSEAPVPREDLLAAIWGYDRRIDTHTLETHIYQLRRKLDSDPRGGQLLVNEQGAYRVLRDNPP